MAIAVPKVLADTLGVLCTPGLLTTCLRNHIYPINVMFYEMDNKFYEMDMRFMKWTLDL